MSATAMDKAPHRPVLLAEVIEALAPRDGAIYVDGTFGAGGYSRAHAATPPHAGLRHRPRSRARSPRGGALAASATAAASTLRRRPLRRHGSHCCARAASSASTAWRSTSASPPCSSTRPSAASPSASTARSTCAWARDGAERRRSGQHRSRRPTSPTSSSDLGEERQRPPRRARHRRRPRGSSRSPAPCELAEIVAAPSGRGRATSIDPATRTFQALRIAVNDELGELDRGLAAAERVLAPGGRLAVVDLPFAGGPRGEALPARRAAATPRGSRHAPAAAASRRPSFRC